MKTRILSLAFLLLISSAFSSMPNAQPTTWTTDTAHSTMLFTIRHVLTPFVGTFKTFNVTLVWDKENPEKSSVQATLDPKSVNTGIENRDNHLRSADFFDANNHGDWTFNSTKITFKDGQQYVATGTLTARGTTHELDIPFQFLGTKDLGKQGQKAGVTAQFTIKRSDYKLGSDMGGTLSDEVQLQANLELNSK